MTRKAPRLLAIACALLLAAPPAAGASVLQSRIDCADRAARPFSGDRTGLVVFDRGNGRLLAAHDGRHEMRPASNTKLAISASALGRLGFTARLHTRVLATGTLSRRHPARQPVPGRRRRPVALHRPVLAGGVQGGIRPHPRPRRAGACGGRAPGHGRRLRRRGRVRHDPARPGLEGELVDGLPAAVGAHRERGLPADRFVRDRSQPGAALRPAARRRARAAGNPDRPQAAHRPAPRLRPPARRRALAGNAQARLRDGPGLRQLLRRDR